MKRLSLIAVLIPFFGFACSVDSQGQGQDELPDAANEDVISNPEAGADADASSPDADASIPPGDAEAGVETGADADAADAPACDLKKAPWEDPCVIQDSVGIFVSSTKGDDAAADGTGTKPYRSVSKALQAAKQGGKKRVYLCAEQYDGAVQAENGISVFGGLDCSDLASWQVSTKHATVKALAGELAALKVQPGTAGVWIGEVDFVGADAEAAGGSSLGAYVENAGVKLERLVITAGKGKAGAAPEAKPAKAANGTQGNAGKDAVCGVGVPDTQLGGASVTNTCGSDPSSSGMGGLAVVNGGGTSGTDGTPSYPLSQPPADGVGGTGGKIAGAACTPGHDGASGPAGEGGTGGQSIGTFASGAYIPSDGSSGTAGKPGQGGGGGGASAGATGCIGASGGGGGSGGCGGKEGAGGKGGGASIALVVLQSTDAVVLKDVTLVSSDGGDGAQGQAGGDGGSGGKPGSGGAAATGVLHGCDGGWGGSGGLAGGGGGGGGGPSIALLFSGKDPQTSSGSANVITSIGPAGKGGQGADPLGTAGDTGIAEASHGF